MAFVESVYAASVSFTFVGDVMCGSDHPHIKYLPKKPSQFFNNTLAYLSNADLTIGNLEGAIANKNAKVRYKGKRAYNFRMPPYTAKMLRYGHFDIMNLANNHSYDFGKIGLKQTIEYLNNEGIGVTGLKGKAFKTNVGALNIHILGFSTYYYHDNLLNLDSSRPVSYTHL
ncbi:MAG: CapA family protein, partial [Alphaproteobacteria bacterium]|nr:CapA family protein [Alphaproteobacteria bacterium]